MTLRTTVANGLRRPFQAAPPPVRDQALVSAGQLASGAGNLLFAVIMARVLSPGAYAELAAFLAAYVLLHVGTGSLGAGSALSPDLASAVRPRLWRIGFGATLLLVALSEPVGALLGLAPGLVIALAVAAPAAAVLSVERGRLYGSDGHRQVVASLAAEPAMRLTFALALALAFGVRGAATGVAAAGWVALAIASPELVGRRWEGLSRRWLRLPGARIVQTPPEASAGDGAAGAQLSLVRGGPAVVAFLLLALVVNQDLLWANRLLPDGEAARFAVLSTLGGLAAFATSTVPLVLLGQNERPRALRTALWAAAGLGGGAVLAVAIAPSHLVSVMFGGRYGDVGALAIAYVAAMAVLGVGRVLAAQLCSEGVGRPTVWAIGGAALLQATLILTRGRTAGAVATSTLLSTIALTAVLAAILAVRHRSNIASELDRRYGPSGPAIPPAPPGRAPARGAPARSAARAVAITGARALAAVAIEGGRWAADRTLTELEHLGARTRSAAATVAGETPRALSRLRTRIAVASRDEVVRGVVALMIAGVAIRIFVERSIWLDEAIAVFQARMSFGDMLTNLRFGDVHPPLHSTVLWATTRVIGTSEGAVRLPSLVAGTLLIAALYGCGRTLFGRRAGLIAAAMGTVAPFLVWYSQEARMYAFFMLFSVLAVWTQAKAVRDGRPRSWVLYAAATALLLWTHYFALLQVVAQQVVFLAALWRRWRTSNDPGRLLRGWIGAMMLVGLAMLPLVPILRDQIVAYGNRGTALDGVPSRAGSELDPQQANLSVYALIANLVWALWGYHSDATMAKIVALWPMGMFLTLFVLGRHRSRWTSALVFVAAAPMLALFGIGLFKRDLFELRYFAGTAPLLILICARLLTTGFRRTVTQVVACVAVVATFAIGLVDQQLNGANPRIYDFRGALAEVGETTRPGDVVLYAPFYLEPVIEYYAPDLDARKLGARLPDPEGRVIVVGSFIEKKEVSARIGGALGRLRATRELVREFEHPRVKVWVFR